MHYEQAKERLINGKTREAIDMLREPLEKTPLYDEWMMVRARYETLRKVLDDERYYPVRQLLSASNEGPLSEYTFEAPLPAAPAASTSTADAALPPAPPSL